MVAIITGGAKGIGKAIAIKFAQLGYDIVLNYRSNVPDELKEQFTNMGANVLFVKGDISVEADVATLIDSAVEKFGRVDVLVNNAGITKDGLIMRMSAQDFDSVIDTNLKGAFLCCRGVSKLFLKQKNGKIINITSVVGISGNAGQANYAASKAGLIGLTKSIAKELGGKGITVNAVAPGFIETDMTEVMADNVKEMMLGRVSLKRFGKVEDVANLVGFLASKDADYITGQVISIDGGLSI